MTRRSVIFAPCELLDPAALQWLLDHGAHPNRRDHGHTIGGHAYPGTALDYIVASYARAPQRLSTCIDILLDAGGVTGYGVPGVLPLLCASLSRDELPNAQTIRLLREHRAAE